MNGLVIAIKGEFVTYEVVGNVYPKGPVFNYGGGYKTGGGRKECSHAEGGRAESFEVVLMQVLAMLKWGAKCIYPFKGGGAPTVLPCLGGRGGGRKKAWTCNFSIL